MNWNISAWCIRNPIPPIVLFLLLTVAGITGLKSLGIESRPNADAPSVAILIWERGAAPAEIETDITRRIEDAVAGVSGVKHMNSSISTGFSRTFVDFELETPGDRAMNDVRDAVARI